jgi:hypothetical protein
MKDLFKRWLLHFERIIKAEKKKFLLLIDNCSAHRNTTWQMGRVKVMFLPPNCTAILQLRELAGNSPHCKNTL